MRFEELEAKISGWAAEWLQDHPQVDLRATEQASPLWRFLSRRLCDLDLSQMEDDAVSVRLFSGVRKVRITGTHGAFLTYEATDGSLGAGLVRQEEVLSSETPKLTAILERLHSEGKLGGP